MSPTPQVLLWGPPLLQPADAECRPLKFERRGQLLALLAADAGRWWSREQLAALFWPGHDGQQARRNLRKVVFLAHELAGDAALQASEHALRWVGGSDLQDFAATPRLELRRGLLLEGFDDASQPAWTDWLQQERQRWQGVWQAAAHRQLDAALRQGDAAGAEALALKLQALDPLDEAATEALMRAQLAAGQPARASDSLRRYAAGLREALGVAPSQALAALLQPAASRPASPLPAQDADFVGRRTELRLLDELLAREGCRWLTLLGPGGVGKSRLARRWLQQHPGAGAWVDLQDLSDAAEVPARLAQALGVDPGPREAPLAPLLLALQTLAEPLWVLDNAEQVQGLGALLAALLAQAPALRLLVTSRVRLHEPPQEWLLPLEGLALPDEDSHDAEAALAFDAVRLFVQRAGAVRPDADVVAQLPAVLDVVELLGGLPLAIELAAAWTRLLPVARIAEQLRASPVELEADAARGRERPQHASLRAVCEGSWALLGERERSALAALTVFAGGFDAAGALAVAGCPLPLLSALVDRSVLGVDAEGRFALHPVIAAFAGEQLAADPARALAMRRAHARHHAQWLARLAPHAVGDTRKLGAVSRELPNLRRAWQQLLADAALAELAGGVRALWAWFEIENRQHEAVELLEPALRLPAETPAGRLLRARVSHGLSMLYHRLGSNAQALRTADAGLLHAVEGEDTEAWIGCLLNGGSALWITGELGAARARFEVALAVARERGHPQCEAWALGNLGVLLMEQGDFPAAETTLLQALAGSRAEGDLYNQAVHLNNLAGLKRTMGSSADLAEAQQWYQRQVDHARACGLPVLALFARLGQGRLAMEQGRVDEAESLLRGVQEQAMRRGKGMVAQTAERTLARVSLLRGDVAGAQARLRPLLRTALSRQDATALIDLLLTWAESLHRQGDAAAARAMAGSLGAPDRLLAQQRRRVRALGLADDAPRRAQPLPALAAQVLAG